MKYCFILASTLFFYIPSGLSHFAQAETFTCQSVVEYAIKYKIDNVNINQVNELLENFWGIEVTVKNKQWIEERLFPWLTQCAHSIFTQPTVLSPGIDNAKISSFLLEMKNTISSSIAGEQVVASRELQDKASRESSLPACASERAIQSYKDAVENSPTGKQGLHVQFLKEVTETSFANKTRYCSAILYTNAGKYSTTYTIEQIENDKYYLNLKINSESQ